MKLPIPFKKLMLWFLAAGLIVVLGVSGWMILTVSRLPRVDYLADPGVSFQLQVPDWQGRLHPFTVGPRNPDWVPLEEIPEDLRNAVLAGEDYSFYSHNGIDWYELYESIKRNFREHRFARGASTLTQQLAKNLFLSRDKTIKRKVKELVLTHRMEKTLTKDRIFELYLNVVELGDMVYGVGAGARHHFGKRPAGLSLRENTLLAAMLPGPKVYDPERHVDRVMNRSEHLLGVMLKGSMITEDQYLAALVEIPFRDDTSDTSYAAAGPVSESGEFFKIQEDLPTEETIAGVTNSSPVESGSFTGSGPSDSDPSAARTNEDANPDGSVPLAGQLPEIPIQSEPAEELQTGEAAADTSARETQVEDSKPAVIVIPGRQDGILEIPVGGD